MSYTESSDADCLARGCGFMYEMRPGKAPSGIRAEPFVVALDRW